MIQDLKNRISVARGLKKADLVLTGGRLVNVFSGEIYRTDVAIHQGTIAGLGEYQGTKTIDLSGKIIIPGLIDSHVHLESSLLTPPAFAQAALRHGATAVIADPHEIANVQGVQGLKYFLSATEGLPLDFYFMLPSCVPATSLESSGARLTDKDLAAFLDHPRVLGLAEMMNYPGVLSGDAHTLRKLHLFRDRIIDGHAPGLAGRDLAAYIGSGISSDHECTTRKEALEKVRLGMTVFIREGSAARDLAALLPAVTERNSRFFCLCTDDLQARDLLDGGINSVVKKTIRLGLDPIIALRMATLNPARHFGLKRKGAILPGYDADLIVIDDFTTFAIEMVIKAGKLIASSGRMTRPIRTRQPAITADSIRIKPISREDISIRPKTGRARVIELIPDQIETRETILPVVARNGLLAADVDHDILRLLVIERHRKTGNIGFGLVKGFGLASGALASTVAHDSHNIIIVGENDHDILTAIHEIKKMRGGMVVVNRGRVLASLPLPVAGLMSDKPAEIVSKQVAALHRAAKGLGVVLDEPYSAMAFLALPVIPDLKLTDKGLVDVKKFDFVDLFV